MLVNKKKLFNIESTERTTESKIINGNPSGVVDFVRPARKWARNLYEVMLNNTWFPQEANMSQDKIPFNNLPKEQKRAYLLVLSQLIMNDSIQTDQLVENIKPYVTDSIVGQCLVRQAFEESLHSKSYATIGEELFNEEELEKVYYYQHEDKELMKKDKAIQQMYDEIGQAEEKVHINSFMKALCANNILENNIFYGGFCALWSLGDRLRGTAKMISFIERDERQHVTLFKNIYKDVLDEVFGGEVPNDLKKDLKDLIDYMTGVEIRWTKYVTKDLFGFTDESINVYIKDKANQICRNMKIEELYPDIKDGGVIKEFIEKKYVMKGSTKTNFFESKVADYAKGSIKIDF